MNGITVSLEELIALQLRRVSLKVRANKCGQQNGLYHSKIRGRGMDFCEVRRYQEGDDIRHMQWRVTAKTGHPHVKLYQEEKERPVFFVADFNPSMYFATKKAFKSVLLARLCAILAWHFSRQGDRVGGILYSGDKSIDLRPKSRSKGVLNLLKALSEQTQTPTSKSLALSEVLLSLRKVARPGSLIVFISDFFNIDQAAFVQMERLRSHNSLLAIQLTDPIELSPPKGNLYLIANQLGKKALLNTREQKNCQQYEAFFHDIEQKVHSLFHAHEHFKLSTSDELDTIINALATVLPNQRVPA